jgi:hypothetical protein
MRRAAACRCSCAARRCDDARGRDSAAAAAAAAHTRCLKQSYRAEPLRARAREERHSEAYYSRLVCASATYVCARRSATK